MRFELPILLWLAPGAALVTLLLAWLVTSRRLKLAQAWSARLLPLARPGRVVSVLLLALAAAAAGFGAAGPRGGRIERTEGGQGLNASTKGRSMVYAASRAQARIDSSRPGRRGAGRKNLEGGLAAPLAGYTITIDVR
jgi:hypothetical protein